MWPFNRKKIESLSRNCSDNYLRNFYISTKLESLDTEINNLKSEICSKLSMLSMRLANIEHMLDIKDE